MVSDEVTADHGTQHGWTSKTLCYAKEAGPPRLHRHRTLTLTRYLCDALVKAKR